MKLLKNYKIKLKSPITFPFKFIKYILIGLKVIFFSLPISLIYKIKKNNNKIPNTILTISFITYLLCVFILTRWFVQTERTKKFTESINNQELIINNNISNEYQDEPTNNTEPNNDNNLTANTNNNSSIDNTNYTNVNLDYYINKNSETIGWIQIKGTNINYPIVQHNNNNYYLEHDFYKKKSSTGWIYADYRNNFNKLDNNTIIYGHNLINKTMFGNLPDFLTSNWLNKKNKPYIKLSTTTHNSVWQIFSVYKIKPTTDYLETKFYSIETYNNFLEKITKRSKKNFNIEILATDKILTLSTCDNTGNYRVVVHAKLIKIQNK